VSPPFPIEQARPFYTAADPVHDFNHVLRVLALAERIGQAEGADLDILRAAALLHDARGSAPGAAMDRAGHHQASAELAGEVLRAAGWEAGRIAAVQHCIRSHRFRDAAELPRTLEAQILFDSDKLDVLGAIGAARAVAYAALAGQPLTGAVSERFRATGEREPGEAHTPYHEFLFKLSRVAERMHTATARALAAGRHRYLAEFFERLERETRGEA
jgi:uncharacterized protein